MDAKNIRPSEEAEKEAMKYPNGWVYVIDDTFKNDEAIPTQAIIGAWKVNEKGIIVGDLIRNPNYVDLKKSS